MPARVLVACLSVLAFTPALAAQTADQATLVFTVAGTYSGAADLWAVEGQPVFRSQVADTFALGRKRSSGLGAIMAGIYFFKPNFGIAGEAFFLGGGFEDSCRHTFESGSAEAARLCDGIDGSSKSSTSVMLGAGPVIRFNSRKVIKPYIRASAGVLIGGRSSVEVASRVTTDFFNIVYDDPDSRNLSLALAGAVGMTANIGPGYQLRWELRDNYIGYDRITAPTTRDGLSPARELDYKHVWSFVIGVDIVLERRRGRRY